jgi:hypothetical protein
MAGKPARERESRKAAAVYRETNLRTIGSEQARNA